jgi:hypothetical protein
MSFYSVFASLKPASSLYFDYIEQLDMSSG